MADKITDSVLDEILDLSQYESENSDYIFDRLLEQTLDARSFQYALKYLNIEPIEILHRLIDDPATHNLAMYIINTEIIESHSLIRKIYRKLYLFSNDNIKRIIELKLGPINQQRDAIIYAVLNNELEKAEYIRNLPGVFHFKNVHMLPLLYAMDYHIERVKPESLQWVGKKHRRCFFQIVEFEFEDKTVTEMIKRNPVKFFRLVPYCPLVKSAIKLN